MGVKRYEPEEIISQLRQLELPAAKGSPRPLELGPVLA